MAKQMSSFLAIELQKNRLLWEQ